MIPALVITLPFMRALPPLLAEHGDRTLCAASVGVAPLIGLVLLLGQHGVALAGQTLTVGYSQSPEVGTNLSLRLDGLDFLFALLILGIGLLVILYAHYYLSGQEPVGRFFALLLLFIGSMLDIMLVENFLSMMLFWELTSLSLFLLISFWGSCSDTRRGMRMALTITGGGGLALLTGVLLFGHIASSFELIGILVAGELIRAHTLYPLVLILALLGVFTKSAQFPFHLWLSRAIATPAPVSTHLHSATMVKAGVFPLTRLYPALAGTEWFFYLISLNDLVMLLLGAGMVLFQYDLKGLLAYSTISHLDLIILLFGLDSPLSNVATVFHITNHAASKASLFMAAGIIDHEVGSRDMRLISGMQKYLPRTTVLVIVTSLAMAGVSLLNGFLSKEMFFGEILSQNLSGSFNWLVPAMAALAGVFSVAYLLHFIYDVFFSGESARLSRFPPHEPPCYMEVPVKILMFLCLLIGMLPAYTMISLLVVVASANLDGRLPEYSLVIWRGLNLPLLMSVVALVDDVLVHILCKPLLNWYTGLPEADVKPVFEQQVQHVVALAARLIAWLENGSLQRYLAQLLGVTLVVVAVELASPTRLTDSRGLTPSDGIAAPDMLILAFNGLITALSYRMRLVVLLTLSVADLLAILAFARFSAPDLAPTQLSVEVVTMVLLMLALYFLSSRIPVGSSSLHGLRDVALAGGVGVLVAPLAYAALTRLYENIAGLSAKNSVSGGDGYNVANVILVGFRSFDTLDETSVLVIAGVSIYAMLTGLALHESTCDPQGRSWAHIKHPLVLETPSRVLLPLTLLISVFIFLRGHNLPGGGFIAGLVTAIALVLQYIVSGSQWVEQRLPLNYVAMAGAGMLIAGLTGLDSWLSSCLFLTSVFGHFESPLIDEIELVTAVLFSLGVYLIVVGAALLVLSYLGKFSLISEPVIQEEAL